MSELTLEQFIAHKKAVNLCIWAELREQHGEAYSIEDRIHFNWPTLTPAETEDVIKAYKQRREDMAKRPKKKQRREPPENEMTKGQRPSSPKRPPKFVIRCELGERLYVESFVDPGEAKLFLDLILKPNDEPFKWASDEMVTSKGGILKVSCAELEQLMEIEDKAEQMPEPIIQNISAFLRGKWTRKVDSNQQQQQRAPSVVGQRRHNNQSDPDMISLQDLCEKNGWEPRVMRGKMRDASWEKPPSGSWRWPKKETDKIEAQLKKLASSK